MITKIVLKHGSDERIIPLQGDRLTFGRKSDNDVYVNDKALSRKHIVFERKGQDWIVRDPVSTNKTYLSGGETRVSRPHPDRPLAEVLESIRDALDDWTVGAPPGDDITVVAARRI